MAAFAVGAAAAIALGWDRERALVFGVVAGAFATVPDVDMVYAFVGVVQWLFASTPASVGQGVWRATDTFWSSSVVVHRAVTHSLPVAVPAAVAFALIGGGRRRRIAGVALLVALVGVAYVASGALGASVMLAFALAGTAVALVAARRTTLSPTNLLVAALLGLVSHPFGDLFTGTPPHFLYPFESTLVARRLALLGDPTLNVVAIFLLELAVIWLALLVYCRLTSRRARDMVDARATVGAGYALAALALPAPTLDVSYPFVFSVLAMGLVGVAPRSRPFRPVRPLFPVERDEALAAVLTGLAAVTLAAWTYVAVYTVA